MSDTDIITCKAHLLSGPHCPRPSLGTDGGGRPLCGPHMEELGRCDCGDRIYECTQHGGLPEYIPMCDTCAEPVPSIDHLEPCDRCGGVECVGCLSVCEGR